MTLQLGGGGAITGCTSLQEPALTLSGLTVSGPLDVEKIIVSSGTAAAPTYTFSGDTDNGLYYAGTNSIGVSTNGTNAILIDSTGNVGIGTTSPGYKCDIDVTGSALRLNSTTAQALLVISSDDNASAKIEFGDESDNDRGAITYDNPNNALIFQANAAERMRIDSSGRLLVGTSTASEDYKLQVNGVYTGTFVRASGSGGPIVSIKRTRGNLPNLYTIVQNNDSLGTLQWAGADGSTYISAASIEAKVDGTPGANDMPGRLVFSTTADGASSPTERMRIDSSGNVGIGTSSPSQKLQVTSGNILLDGTDQYIYLSNDADQWLSANAASNYLRIGTANTERLRIDSSGRLLVGTTSAFISGDEKKLQMLHAGAGAEIILGRDDQSVGSGNSLGAIKFVGNAGSYQIGAEIEAKADGTQGDNDKPTRLEFSTTADGASSPTERMRIDSSGATKMTTNGSYYFGGTGSIHEMNVTNNGNWIGSFVNMGTSAPHGLTIRYKGTSPNNNSSYPLHFEDLNATRFRVQSDGGIANFQAYNSNLCDEREKKNIEPLDSTWNCLKNWELKKFHYNEADDTEDKKYGVIAQQIAPHCPEVITEWTKQRAEDAVLDEDGNVVTPAQEQILRKGVKEQQMMWIAIKALQEAMTRIETLEQRLSDAGIA